MMLLLLTGCANDDLHLDGDVNSVHRDTPYARALAKLQRSHELTGRHRTRSGLDGIQGVIPLCYGDTVTIGGGGTGTVDPNPGADDPIYIANPDEWLPANDSIYAYVFDYENQQGFTVVTTEDWMPDILMYSHKGNFLRFTPTVLDDACQGDYSDYQEWIERQINTLLREIANILRELHEEELLYSELNDPEFGMPGYSPPHVTGYEKATNCTTSFLYGNEQGTCKVSWNIILLS